MYCYTKINHLMCIFNEMLLWAKISKEHPLFIKDLAEITKKSLPGDTSKRLGEIHESFSLLEEKSRELRYKIKYSIKIQCSFLYTLKEYIEAFLHLNKLMLLLLDELKNSYSEDKLWQTILKHMAEEHTYSYEVFMNISDQLK